MGDLFDILFKLGSISSNDTLKACFRFLRIVMLSVFAAFLYRHWVNDFNVATSMQEIVNYFMSNRFLYAVLIYLFVLGCEFIGMILVAKLNTLLFVGKALKFAEALRLYREQMPEGEKLELRNVFDVELKKKLSKVFKWFGDEINEKEVNKLIPKPEKLKPEQIDGYSLIFVELYIYMLCTGHSLVWGLLLIVILVACAVLKSLLIIGKNVLPILVEYKKKSPSGLDKQVYDATIKKLTD